MIEILVDWCEAPEFCNIKASCVSTLFNFIVKTYGNYMHM